MASLIFKIAVFLILFLILVSLGSGLFFLARDKGRSTRVVTSLSVRVGLSVALFLLLMIGYLTGLINPHGLAPEPANETNTQAR